MRFNKANDEILSPEYPDKEVQVEHTKEEHAKEIYNALNTYLILIAEMRNKGLQAKTMLEEVLGISDED